MHRIIPLLLAALLLATPLHAAEGSLSADFQASLEFNSEDLNSPKAIPVLQFDGSILVAGDRVRVDTINSITEEPTVALLDISTGSAALLYPFNLNGERMSLGDDFRSGYLDLFMKFARGEKLGQVEGWKLAVKEGAGGLLSYVYSNKSSRSITFDIGGPENTRSLVISSPKVTVRIRLSGVSENPEVDDTQFSVPADYAMREVDKKLADELPSL